MSIKIKNKAFNKLIVAPKELTTQRFKPKSHKGDRQFPSLPFPSLPDFQKLNNLILDQCLSESLEMLEPYGFGGFSGLYVIKFLQLGGVA
jgi:hypothetical protein